MFAHVLQQRRKVYYGLCIGGGFRTTFQISQLRRIPAQYGHLAGLLEIFKGKLVSCCKVAFGRLLAVGCRMVCQRLCGNKD